jgi:hypothetical protein
MRYQQNLTSRKLALVLSTNNWSFVQASIGAVMAAVEAAAPGSYFEVEIPTTSK